jgi:hypothetical protein
MKSGPLVTILINNYNYGRFLSWRITSPQLLDPAMGQAVV